MRPIFEAITRLTIGRFLRLETDHFLTHLAQLFLSRGPLRPRA